MARSKCAVSYAYADATSMTLSWVLRLATNASSDLMKMLLMIVHCRPSWVSKLVWSGPRDMSVATRRRSILITSPGPSHCKLTALLLCSLQACMVWLPHNLSCLQHVFRLASMRTLCRSISALHPHIALQKLQLTLVVKLVTNCDAGLPDEHTSIVTAQLVFCSRMR